MGYVSEISTDAVGSGLARHRLGGPLVLRDDELPPDTLRARDRLIVALHGDDVDEQREAFEELRRLKLCDFARVEAAAATRRSREIAESSWKRIDMHHLRREP